MPITEAELITGIETKNGFPLDPAQRQAITYGAGPLLIAAGPGTGKTEVLVARCLKFICCDSVAPGSIILTTWTVTVFIRPVVVAAVETYQCSHTSGRCAPPRSAAARG